MGSQSLASGEQFMGSKWRAPSYEMGALNLEFGQEKDEGIYCIE